MKQIHRARCRIALDIDDVLAVCIAYAISKYNKEHGCDETMNEVLGWCGPDVPWTKYFGDKDFVRTQPVSPGAQEFVRQLIARGCDVMVTTAVPAEVMAERFEWVRRNFPEIPAKNIVMSNRKDIFDVDIAIDDAPHNVLHSHAKYPVLMRRPWNQEVTGVTAANSFDDCLNLVDAIMRRDGQRKADADIICLVGPSGAGKHSVISEAVRRGYVVPPIETTNKMMKQSFYHPVEKKAFEYSKDQGEYVETTSYAGHYYGIRHNMIEDAPTIIPIDICGAFALQRVYGDRVATVYLNRSRLELVSNILDKQLPDKEKALRIVALDGEERNASLCDVFLSFTNVEDVVAQIQAITKEKGGNK
jgi:guanylate kinase